MLKRHDLSKQFELVVQQEIKNFQNTSYQINQTLNELRSNIEDVEIKIWQNQALIDSRIKKLEIQIELLQQEHQKAKHILGSHVNETDVAIKSIQDNLGYISKYSIDVSEKHEHAMEEIQSLHDSIHCIEENVKRKSEDLGHYLVSFEFRLRKELSNLKQELINLPSDSEEIRKEFKEGLESHKVDVEGIKKEFKVNRKEFMVIEKNLENIYTLIDGLKKAGAK